jgi:hypothetical protein
VTELKLCLTSEKSVDTTEISMHSPAFGVGVPRVGGVRKSPERGMRKGRAACECT